MLSLAEHKFAIAPNKIYINNYISLNDFNVQLKYKVVRKKLWGVSDKMGIGFLIIGFVMSIIFYL